MRDKSIKHNSLLVVFYSEISCLNNQVSKEPLVSIVPVKHVTDVCF